LNVSELPHSPTSFGGTKAGKIASGAVIGGALVGGGYLIHRSRKAAKATMARSGRTKTMASKALINPFEQVVVFGKAYDVSFFPQSSTRIRALVPTGAHVGHGQKLGHYRGKNTSPRTNVLRHYTGHGKGLRQGPFSKELSPLLRSLTSTPAARAHAAKIGPGAKEISRQFGKKPKRFGLNSNNPSGPNKGSRL